LIGFSLNNKCTVITILHAFFLNDKKYNKMLTCALTLVLVRVRKEAPRERVSAFVSLWQSLLTSNYQAWQAE
jgi:hypothetical protein